MKLTYSAPANSPIRSILVELNAGETLGNHVGPVAMTVPVVEGNKEYDEIVAKNLTVSEPPAPAPVVPETISRRQFFQQLALDGEITEEEAESAAAGIAIPAALATAISSLSAADQFSARMYLKGAVTFERRHPMTETLGTLMTWTPARMDALWTNAFGLN